MSIIIDKDYISNAIKFLDFDINNIDGKTHYINKNGIYVPRVTDIISYCSDQEGIIYWANSLGFRRLKYKEELEKAASIGTNTHEAIEMFLKSNIQIQNNIPLQGFINWFNYIKSNNKIEVLKIEEPLIGSSFGGTCDLLISINNRIFIVDYKTSNKVRINHFIQLSAYRALLFELYGIVADGVLILHLDKNDPIYEEYVLDFTIDDHYIFIENCYRTFLSMVYCYYNTIHTESLFNNIFYKEKI